MHMASTFTPNLHLEKPAHGDHASDWDAVLNANFDALDAAAGRAPVVTSDPATPAGGQMWVRSDLAQLRVRVGAVTLKIDLAAV
jgi:hypothetical protein